MHRESMEKKATIMSTGDLKANLMKLNRREERTDLEEHYRKLLEKEYLQRLRGEKKDPHMVIGREPISDTMEDFDPWTNTSIRAR